MRRPMFTATAATASTAATVTAAFLALALVSGCATAPDPSAPVAEPDSIIDSSPGQSGPPLPAGAVLNKAGSHVIRDIDTRELQGSYQPDSKTPAERIPFIVKRARLIVGVDQSNNLLSSRDSLTGELQGFEIDLAHELARDIFGDPNRVDFRFVTSSERTQALSTGRVDLVIRSMTMTAQRQKVVEFSLPYLVTQTRLLVESSSGITGIDDLTGKVACAASGSTSIELVRRRAPQADILATSTWGDCLMALQQGQVDAVVTDDVLLSGMREQDPYTQIVGESISEAAFAVGIRKPDSTFDSRGLVRQVNSTIERIRSDGTWAQMYDRWFAAFVPLSPLPAPNYREEDQ